MKLEKEKIYGYAGAAVFCLIIFLILWFTFLKTIVPGGEEGILVNFGNVNEAAGLFEPMNMGDMTNMTPQQPLDPQPLVEPDEGIITQNMEESVALEEQKQKEEEERLRAEEQKRIEEEQRRLQAISNQVAGAFGAANSAESSQGTGEGIGNEGSPDGNSDQGANTGVGGRGEFSLEGRSIGPDGLPLPSYSVQEEGRIVIDITVNPQGSVILATIGKGTTIDNASMRRSALDAAKRARFNTIAGTTNQSGTITYRYYLR